MDEDRTGSVYFAAGLTTNKKGPKINEMKQQSTQNDGTAVM